MRVLVTVGVVCLLAGADAPGDVAKKDLAKFQGEWVMTSGDRDGQAIPAEYLRQGKLVFKDGEVTMTLGDMLLMKARGTLDPGKTPRTIGYDVTDGFFKGKRQLGIYEIDGDTVKFCFANPDQDRPADFTVKAGSGRTLSVWKKEEE